MGTSYFCHCLDCKDYIDIGKLYYWCPRIEQDDESDEALDQAVESMLEDLNLDNAHFFIKQSLYLHWFMNQHKGHRIAVVDEHDPIHEEILDSHWNIVRNRKA